MKRILGIALVALLCINVQAKNEEGKYHAPIKIERKWKNYHPGNVRFVDKAPKAKVHRSITALSHIP